MANCLKHIKKTNEIIFTVFSLHIKTLYQKTNKSISYSFFLYIWKQQINIIKKIKKSSEKKHMKDIKDTKKDLEKKHAKNIKIFLKKKKTKKRSKERKKDPRNISKSFWGTKA